MMWILLLVMVPCAVCVEIPEIHTIGSHYEIGRDVGRTFRAVIQDYYNLSQTLASVSQFIETSEGKKYYSGYLNAAQNVFPRYMDELRGIADGADVSFTQAFSMMIGSEVNAILKLKGVESCSDIYVNDQQVAIGHNEDGDPLIKDRGYLVHATILDEAGSVVEKYTAYTYPGVLSGNAFSFNGDGKVFTINALYPSLVEANKIPRYLMARALLGVKSQSDLEDLLSGLGVGVAYGFNVNYADTRNSSGLITNYEVSPMSGVSKSLVSKLTVGKKGKTFGDKHGHYYHFNMYEHTNISQIPKSIISSKHRKVRADNLPVPANVLGITVILGDDADTQYPIYRTPRPTDKTSTVATGIFVLDSCILMLFKSNPRTTTVPIMTLDLPIGPMCQL